MSGRLSLGESHWKEPLVYLKETFAQKAPAECHTAWSSKGALTVAEVANCLTKSAFIRLTFNLTAFIHSGNPLEISFADNSGLASNLKQIRAN